jgi:hypothetical protein
MTDQPWPANRQALAQTWSTIGRTTCQLTVYDTVTDNQTTNIQKQAGVMHE